MAKKKLNDMEIVEPQLTPAAAPAALDPTAADFTERLMAELNEGEVWEDDRGRAYPRVVGLRRLLRKYFAVVEQRSDPPVLGPVEAGGVPYVGVTHHITVLPVAGFPQRASGTAVAGPHNLDGFVYAGETAETRAEGRALVRLFGLSTCTSDEIAKSVPPIEVRDTLTDTQASAVRALCDKVKKNPRELVREVAGENAYGSLTEVPQTHYKALIRRLDELQKEFIK